MKRSYDINENIFIPTDIHYEVMLRTPFNQLKLLCQTNQYYHQLCQNQQFWLQKLKYDQLVLPTSFLNKHNYIKIYEILQRITNNINLIKYKQQEPVFINYDLLDVLQFFEKYIPIQLNMNQIDDITENIEHVEFNQYGNHYQLEFEYNKEWDETGELINFDVYQEVITRQQLIDILYDGYINQFFY